METYIDPCKDTGACIVTRKIMLYFTENDFKLKTIEMAGYLQCKRRDIVRSTQLLVQLGIIYKVKTTYYVTPAYQFAVMRIAEALLDEMIYVSNVLISQNPPSVITLIQEYVVADMLTNPSFEPFTF